MKAKKLTTAYVLTKSGSLFKKGWTGKSELGDVPIFQCVDGDIFWTDDFIEVKDAKTDRTVNQVF